MTHFTTITAALAQADALLPTSGNPVELIIFNGTYVEDVTLVSNVNLTGASLDILIQGNVVYKPGVGVNARQNADTEQVALEGITTLQNFTFDTTGKTGMAVPASLRAVFCLLGNEMGTGSITISFRSTGTDQFAMVNTTVLFGNTSIAGQGQYFANSTIVNGDTSALNGCQLFLKDVQLDGNLNVDTQVDIIMVAGLVFGSTAIKTSTLKGSGIFSGPITAGNNAIVVLTGSQINSLQVDPTSQANVMSSFTGTLLGPGQIDRDVVIGTVTTDGTGLAAFNLNGVPFIDDQYTSAITQLGGIAGPTPVISVGQNNLGFTFQGQAATDYQISVHRATSSLT